MTPMGKLQHDLTDMHIKIMFMDRFRWLGEEEAVHRYRTDAMFHSEVMARVNAILRLVDIHINGNVPEPMFQAPDWDNSNGTP